MKNKIGFILVKPQIGENIGACARSLKNFGFSKLHIISPKQSWPNNKAKATSVGAYDIIKKAKIFDNTSDAISDFDVVISLNNYHAGYAAVAHNPCLTIPIGLRKSNEPAGITFIGKSFSEQLLYEIGLYFEESYEGRVPPKNSN